MPTGSSTAYVRLWWMPCIYSSAPPGPMYWRKRQRFATFATTVVWCSASPVLAPPSHTPALLPERRCTQRAPLPMRSYGLRPRRSAARWLSDVEVRPTFRGSRHSRWRREHGIRTAHGRTPYVVAPSSRVACHSRSKTYTVRRRATSRCMPMMPHASSRRRSDKGHARRCASSSRRRQCSGPCWRSIQSSSHLGRDRCRRRNQHHRRYGGRHRLHHRHRQHHRGPAHRRRHPSGSRHRHHRQQRASRPPSQLATGCMGPHGRWLLMG